MMIKNTTPGAKRILTPEKLIQDTKRGEPLTTWVNPTKNVLRGDLFIEGAKILLEGIEDDDGHHVGRTVQPATWVRVEVPPGGSVELPASLDQGVHQTDRNGVVVGGMLPQLRRADATGAPLVFAAGMCQ